MANTKEHSAESPLLNVSEAAAFLRVSARTLQSFNQKGGGPARVQLAPRRVAYRRTDLEAWLDAKTTANRAG